MKVSVIIPAYNEEDVIERTIKSVLNQSVKPYEVIVVNDASTDRTASIVKKYSKVKLVTNKQNLGHAGTRNHGAKIAKGDVLFFLDADEWLTRHVIRNINRLFKNYEPDAIITNRLVSFPKDASRVWVYEFSNNWCVNKGTSIEPVVSSAPYVIKKQVFERLGRFPKDSYYFEDYIMMQKVNAEKLRVLVTDEVTVKSDMGASFNDFFKRARNIGRGVMRSDVPGKRLRTMVYPFILTGLILLPPLYLLFALAYGITWYRRSSDWLTGFCSPFLFTLKKFISFYYAIKEWLK